MLAVAYFIFYSVLLLLVGVLVPRITAQIYNTH